MDVAIIGIGIHPFGRFDDLSALDMGVTAARQALSDAGVAWGDVQFAVGGSLGSTQGTSAAPDAMVSRLGLTGVPFVNVSNGCAHQASRRIVCPKLRRTRTSPSAMRRIPPNCGVAKPFETTGSYPIVAA